MGQPADVAREPRAAPHLQPTHLGIGEEAVLGQLTPQDRELGQPAEVPPPRSGDGTDPVAVAGQQGHDHFAEGQQGGLREYPHQGDPGVALEDGAQLMAALQGLHGGGVAALGLAGHRQRLEPAGDHLPVAHPGVRGDHDAGAGHLAAPGEVEVLPHGDDARVESFELGEQVRPHQNAAARCHEDIAHRVVLPVVDLAFGDAIHDGARLVTGHADMEKDAPVVPVHELRGHHPGVGSERLLDHLVHRVVVQRDIVVEEQKERRTLHHGQRLVRCGGVTGVARQVPDEGVGQDPGHPVRHLGVVLPSGQDENRELLVVLGRQRGEGLFEPGPGVGRDHDGDHGRHLGVHQGAEAIRSGIHPFRHEMHLQCLLLFNIRDTLVHEHGGLPAAAVSRTSV